MARCQQAAAAAAATAIATFRRECSALGAQANSLEGSNCCCADKIVSDFWVKSESYAAAFASEEAVLLPARGPGKITQEITNTYSEWASLINR
jgi:hypothetical protein